eukprot:5342062-Amphidinium_carterae.1
MIDTFLQASRIPLPCATLDFGIPRNCSNTKTPTLRTPNRSPTSSTHPPTALKAKAGLRTSLSQI